MTTNNKTNNDKILYTIIILVMLVVCFYIGMALAPTSSSPSSTDITAYELLKRVP